MTPEEVAELFTKHEGEFLEFERIPSYARKHERPDLCAMLYLHDRFGGTGDAVAAAEHDVIWLDWQITHITEQDVIYLQRCGVLYDDETESLRMFV